MLMTQLCAELKNYFLRDYNKDIHTGEYTISDGSISLPFLLDGQYYRIVGSALNDGVYKYGDRTNVLSDETFKGAIWAMAVPPAVVALAEEIEGWQKTNATVLDSPYQSESFGGYSYSKAGSGISGGGAYSWRDHFASRLNPYRRLFLP